MNFVRALFFSAIFLCLVPGCATNPKVDWPARIGNYTFDQAMFELGPPDKAAKLSDGSTLADWYDYRGSGVSLGTGIGVGPVGVGVGVPVGGNRVHVRRLVFGPDNILRSVSRY